MVRPGQQIVLSPRSCKALVTDKERLGAEEAGRLREISQNTVYRRIRLCSKDSLKPYLRARRHNTRVDLDPTEVLSVYHKLRSVRATAEFFNASVETINKIIPPRQPVYSTSKQKLSRKATGASRKKSTCRCRCPNIKQPPVIRMKSHNPVEFPEGCSNCGATRSSSFRQSPTGDGSTVCNRCRHSLQKAQSSACVKRCKKACKGG